MSEAHECRCCRAPIKRGMLACYPHWTILPRELRKAITQTYSAHNMRAFAANVHEADRLWKEAGLWKPGEAKVGK